MKPVHLMVEKRRTSTHSQVRLSGSPTSAMKRPVNLDEVSACVPLFLNSQLPGIIIFIFLHIIVQGIQATAICAYRASVAERDPF